MPTLMYKCTQGTRIRGGGTGNKPSLIGGMGLNVGVIRVHSYAQKPAKSALGFLPITDFLSFPKAQIQCMLLGT